MLNPVQREAVKLTEGPVLILAGAGTGKTRVLTHRIAWMLDRRVCRPWEVLALTFTNKAAREMKERIARLVGTSIEDIWVGTFHSIFARILRREADFIGYGRNFTIYDADDQLRLIKHCMEQLKISPNQLNPKRVRSEITSAKNAMLDPEQFAGLETGFIHERISEVYRDYAGRLFEANAMDFDDLLLKPIELFESRPDRLEVYRRRFSHVLIDEYQDTNPAQFDVTRRLCLKQGNICVVGDDDQSIYGWRGADLRNILDFEEHWPEARVFKLEQNYRSGERILDAAHAVVSLNEGRKPKKLWTEAGPGEPVTLLAGEDEQMEAAQVCQRIIEGRDEGRPLGDFVALYRTNAQSRALEESLRRNGLRYDIVGGLRFYERREVKDVLAYLRLLANPGDAVSLLRVINYPRRGIGDSSLRALQAFAAAARLPLMDALPRAGEAEGVSRGAAKRCAAFHGMLERCRTRLAEAPPQEVLEELLEQTKLVEALEAEGPEGVPRIENVRELQAALAAYDENSELGLEGFLEEVALVSDVDAWEDRSDHVTLMTVHSAKGLEFDTVFVTGLEEGLFPLAGAFDDPDELEEERRLFYVAATRAKRKLYLCYAMFRRRFGRAAGGIPSSFLDAIPAETLEESPELNAAVFIRGPGAARRKRGEYGGRSVEVASPPRTPGRRGAEKPPTPRGFGPGEYEPGAEQAVRRQPKSPGRRASAGSRGKSGIADRRREAMLDRYSPFRGGNENPGFDPDSQEPEISDPSEIYRGCSVLHPRYGRGVVIHTIGFGDEMRVSVRFDSVGVKKMVVRLAKLRVVD